MAPAGSAYGVRRAWRALGSHALTAYLLFAYCVLVAHLAIFGARVPSAVVENISRLAPFGIAYVVLAAHLLACLVVFFAVVRQRASLAPPPLDPLRGPAPLRANALMCAPAVARRRGFRVRWLDPGRSVVAYRHRLAPVGTLLFHAALLLLPLAVVASRATRFRGDAWIVEGHAFTGTRAEYVHVEPSGDFDRRAPHLRFDVENVEATFWGDRLYFTDLRALLVRGNDASWITLPGPLREGGARVSIHGFNYTPSFRLATAEGRVLAEQDLGLRLFPPGTPDSFDLPGLPHRAWVRLWPDAGDDGPTSSMALGRPLLDVVVTRGKRVVAHGRLRAGERLAFDGLSLAFPTIRRGGEILVHRDLGYPVLWLALALALAGTVARVCFPSVRVWIVETPDGPRALVREDAFAGGRGAALVAEMAA